MSAKEPVRAEHVIDALRKKYTGDKFACFEQLRNGTGHLQFTTTIDFAVVHLWPSEGLTRSAFEVKVSRTDFTREIERPNKNEFFRTYFHEFWYATAPGVVADIREIPDGCGWLELRGDKLVKKLVAQRKKDVETDELLLASFCRSLNRQEKTDEAKLRNKILSECRELQELRTLKKAVRRFAEERGSYIDEGRDEDTILKHLRNCLEDRDQSKELEILADLQNKLFEVWVRLTPIIAVGLREIDDTGKRLHSLYGNDKLFGFARDRIEAHPRFKEKLKLLDDLTSQESVSANSEDSE